MSATEEKRPDAITLEGVEARYGTGHKALTDVSCSFEYGTSSALIGANGSGKTTLLRLMSGLSQPSAGTISPLPAKKSVAMVAQQHGNRTWVPVTYANPLAQFGGSGYPLTETGRAGQARWDPEQDPALQCIPPGMPTVMANPYPVEFEDRGDTIVMRLEEWDGERIFYLNAEGEPSQPRMGRSVGRWDGNSLVVETREIDWRYVDDVGTPQSEGAVINERFTLSEDGTDLTWTAEVTDPVNFTEPVPMEVHWTWIPGHEVKPFNCELPADSQ